MLGNNILLIEYMTMALTVGYDYCKITVWRLPGRWWRFESHPYKLLVNRLGAREGFSAQLPLVRSLLP